MRTAASRALMALAACCLGESRREWSVAMHAEFDAAAAEGDALRFAFGCLVAALRELPVREEGRLVLASHVLALGLMVPMAALQIGCAILGFPYLYPGRDGLAGALLEGRAHEALLRGLYQAAVPSFAALLLLLGVGHLGIAWAMLDRDWSRVTRIGALMLASATTLVIFMSVFFLDCAQALLQAGLLTIEIATVAAIARWHGRLCAAAATNIPNDEAGRRT